MAIPDNHDDNADSRWFAYDTRRNGAI